MLSSDARSTFDGIAPVRFNSSKTRARMPFFAHRHMRMYTVCHGPKRAGSARHVQPCSMTCGIPFSASRASNFSDPRGRGSSGLMLSNCSSVSSIAASLPDASQ